MQTDWKCYPRRADTRQRYKSLSLYPTLNDFQRPGICDCDRRLRRCLLHKGVEKRDELAAKFYPFPENQKSLETTKRMAGHALGGVFYNPRTLPPNTWIIYPDADQHD